MTLWWLSFCDSAKPAGEQFLGACIVPIDATLGPNDLVTAVRAAHALGCNPGGECVGLEIQEAMQPHVRPEWVGRLLTREECGELDREMSPHLPS